VDRSRRTARCDSGRWESLVEPLRLEVGLSLVKGVGERGQAWTGILG
jgi:hypothetical protein